MSESESEYNEEEDVGIHFDPTIEEITEYLELKRDGEDVGDFIETKDVYAKEPWLLDHTNNTFFKENEWYYFSKRRQISEKKIGRGKNTKRKISGENNNDGIDRGNWRMNWKKDISDTLKEKNLTYKKSNKRHKGGDGDASSAINNVAGSESTWIMNEYVLEDLNDKFQELVLCKIHKKKDTKNKDDQASNNSLEHKPISEDPQVSLSATGEGQIEYLHLMIEGVPEENDEQVEGTEVTHEVERERDWVDDLMDECLADEQQPSFPEEFA